MERYLTLGQILHTLDACQPEAAVARLRAGIEELNTDPDDLRVFEYVTDDAYFGNEGARTHYYLWRYTGSTPPGFTGRIYTFAREDDAGEYVMAFGAAICPERDVSTWTEPDDGANFLTAHEAIDWLETELGWKLDTPTQPAINEVR
jgi:hypothetical protein